MTTSSGYMLGDDNNSAQQFWNKGNCRFLMSSRLKWTKQEEQQLKHLKENQEVWSWNQIAERLIQKFPTVRRSGKQCRQRYVNYVRFGKEISKSHAWTQEQDRNFISLYSQYGPSWSSIVKQMPGKSENCLKNRFYGGLRRIIRKINHIQREHKMKKTKPLRYETLHRVLDYVPTGKEPNISGVAQNENFLQFLDAIKANLLQAILQVFMDVQDEESLLWLINSLHQFNARIRGLAFKARRKTESKKGFLQNSNPSQLAKEQEISVEAITTQNQELSGNQRLTPPAEESGCSNQQILGENKWLSEIQDEMLSLEMKSFSPKIEHLASGEDLDLEISKILQIPYTCQSFSFFE